MITGLRNIIPAAASALLALAALPGCFTGIERTAVIKDKDSAGKSASAVAPERALLVAAAPQPPAEWRRGKPFIVAEGNVELAFTPASEARALAAGDTLRFLRIESAARLAGDSVTNLVFLGPAGHELTHRIDGPRSALMRSGRLPVPFTVDADVVEAARSILKGRELWTKRPVNGARKFERVRVADVLPGTPDYPLTVVLDNGVNVSMVPESKTNTARTIDNLFSLTDPRRQYPDISDKNWELICNGKIAAGMTREECRLALGAPATVEREAAYNGIVERWTYENGVYLYFTDGLLTSFRN